MLSDFTVGQYLAAVASDAPAPGGGAVAALVVAQAAALAAMAGRFSVGRACDLTVDECVELIAAADSLREAASPLADADADAYEAYLAAVRMPREPDIAARSRAIAAARSRAADVPLATAEAAAAVVELAVRVAEGGNQHLRGDATAAALLGAAAAGIAAVMVGDNIGNTPDDTRVQRACTAAAAARSGADRLTGVAEASS